MKIIFKNTKNIIIAFAFAFVCLAGADTAEAGCYRVCDPIYAPCPSGYSVWQNQIYPWALSPYGWACFPCTGYCWIPGAGHSAGPVCATGLLNGCIDIGSYLVGWNCYERCNGDCNNSIRNACTTPSSLTASIWQGETATHWTWYCPGKNGGSNSVQCSLAKPINGQCGSTKYACNTPAAATSLGENTTQWTWTCPGSNGGTDANCSLLKPVPGVCSSPKDHRTPCVTGNVANFVTSADKWTWDCNGANGGGNEPNCTETNCAPNTCVGTQCSNTSGDVAGTKAPTWGNVYSCTSTTIECELDDCGLNIPTLEYTGCTEYSTNNCGTRSCDISKCGTPTTQPCNACPIKPGAWREVSP